MCKIITLTNLNNVKNLRKMTDVIFKHIGKTERDGLGLAVQSDAGLYVERSLGPIDLGRKETKYFSFAKKKRTVTGRLGEIFGAGIFHGRTSTNDKTLLNTHPIVKNDWTLIHNGVVSNIGPAYPMITTNDTEHLVHYLSTGGIDVLSANLTGYYAAAAFSPNGDLIIFRDSIATLFCAYVKTIDSLIFATTADLIRSVAKDLKWKIDSIQEVDDDTYLVFRDNTLIEERKFKSLGYSRRESQFASKSLGYELNNDGLFESTATSNYGHDWTAYDSAASVFNEDYDDETHEIFTVDGERISSLEYLKLDEISQNQCVIRKVSGL